jgi:hypothetical protein
MLCPLFSQEHERLTARTSLLPVRRKVIRKKAHAQPRSKMGMHAEMGGMPSSTSKARNGFVVNGEMSPCKFQAVSAGRKW